MKSYFNIFVSYFFFACCCRCICENLASYPHPPSRNAMEPLRSGLVRSSRMMCTCTCVRVCGGRARGNKYCVHGHHGKICNPIRSCGMVHLSPHARARAKQTYSTVDAACKAMFLTGTGHSASTHTKFRNTKTPSFDSLILAQPLHTYIHTYMYARTYVRSYVHTCAHPLYVPTYTKNFIYLCDYIDMIPLDFSKCTHAFNVQQSTSLYSFITAPATFCPSAFFSTPAQLLRCGSDTATGRGGGGRGSASRHV